jgi:Lauroyl/myristoyl acyltransferase
MVHLLTPIERYLRQHLNSELDRQRFDRAKRFVDESVRRGDIAHRINARWLKFLCSRTPVRTNVWPEDADFLRHCATVFGVPPDKTREFVGLSLLGRLWRACYFDDLAKGPPELVARLTRVIGWEHFDRCRRDGKGLILVPVHTQFARLFLLYLRHRGHDGLEVGITHDKLEAQGLRTTVAKQFELARQMHAAKHLLTRGGIVFNPPDARQNLDHSRPVEFFGRQRQLAAGFAELALKTEAHVVPVVYRFTPRGTFALEFGAPFDVLGPESTHDERVDSFVAQYANFLRDEWRRYPWNIPWNHLLHYCLLPEAGSGAPGAQAVRSSVTASGEPISGMRTGLA